MQTQWNILRPDPGLAAKIQQHLGCDPIIAAILANRNIDGPAEAAAFLNPSLENLPSPDLLPDLDLAVQRIMTALRQNEKILIVGDYDADGVTATAVMVSFLRSAGARVDYHLPHRVHEGYGFHSAHVAQLAAPRKTGLIITVDCGSTSYEAVEAARRHHIDVIVTDHHNMEGKAPDALAVVNPKRSGQKQALRELAGVGVAFYVTIALRTELRKTGWWQNRPEPNLKALCDLVAIGTIADVVPLKGVNRVLAKAGLDQINTCARTGIRSALEASGVRRMWVSSDDIAYRLAPRINAAGRMAHAKIAFDLLTATEPLKAQSLSETLNALNHRRQSVENDIFQTIVDKLEDRPDLLARKCLFLAGSNWHEGVLGIVAAKLVSHYYKPVVLVSTLNGTGKGSARSIPQLDLFDALSRCADLVEKFGGHRAAAGLTVPFENIGPLKKKFESVVEQMLDGIALQPSVTIDCEIDFEQVTPALVDAIETLEPFGAGNPAPVFLARNVQVLKAYTVGRGHRKMALCQNGCGAEPFQAIQFNMTPDTPRYNFFSQMAFRLQWNRFRGNKQIQIVVEAVS